MINKYTSLILILSLFTQSIVGIASKSPVDPNQVWIAQHIEGITKNSTDLDPKVLALALEKYKAAFDQGRTKSPILSVVDYTKKSGTPRFWVIDLTKDSVLFHELVAHGKNSGDHFFATRFSNKSGSKQSSLGVFLTGNTYLGKHGYSMTLNGVQKGLNDNALRRRVVLHGAHYVNEHMAKKKGHVGRSFGCLSVRPQVSRKIIDVIKDGSMIFSYHPQLLA